MIGVKTFALMSSAKPSCTSLPLKYWRCWYATKKYTKSSFTRWNAENKLLYGAKLKPSGTKKAARVSRKSKSELSVTRMEDSSARATGQQLEGMSITQRGIIRDESCVHGDEWYQESGHVFESFNASFDAGFHNPQSKNGIDIPEILPIPGGKDAVKKSKKKSVPKTNAKVTKSAESDTLLPPKETDFILQCPILPSQSNSQALFSPVSEFQTFVDSLKMRYLPSVNTILNKTRSDLSNFFLLRWQEKMVKELGEAGFQRHKEGIIWQGTNLHASVQQYLSGVPFSEIDIKENIQGHWDSIASVLPEVTDVQALETSVSHPWLLYKGTFDCVAKYKNLLYVIDWKTSSKPKPLLSNLYDNPLQVVAYLGALNHSKELTSKCGMIENAAIVIAYHNGESAHVHKLQPALCQHYWHQWCQRVQLYWATVAKERAAKL